ncbi:YgjV family protein [bacterium]|nr:YgjV family protein [bacterium]
MSLDWVEIVGYTGSVLVAVSLMMSSVVRLRWINLVGAATFAVYGGLVGAYPVLALNGFIAVVDAWYLWKMGRERDWLSLLPVRDPEDSYLRGFLDFHADDVAAFFPDFRLDAVADPRIAFILRDMNPAGLVVWEEGERDALIHLDYVLPPYRDLRCARFFLDRMAPSWRAQGLERVLSPASGAVHRDYLRRLGFVPALPQGLTLFARDLQDGPRGPAAP